MGDLPRKGGQSIFLPMVIFFQISLLGAGGEVTSVLHNEERVPYMEIPGFVPGILIMKRQRTGAWPRVDRDISLRMAVSS